MLIKILFAFQFLFLFKFHVAEVDALSNEQLDCPIVEIDSNDSKTSVKGTRNSTWNGGIFYSFRGIPYAQPPVGDLRFKDPLPEENLPDLIDARYDGHDCPSLYAINASENCLILNVYTRSLSQESNLPVLVFIHPGGLYIGSSLSSFVGPEYFLVKPIVLVTFNYRLGTLGFLNLGTKEVPGNAGFKDQVLAMRWVQKYVKYFGGNPNDITLMGYSAGGLSVSLHLVSPMSQGLFHKAIIMSGAVQPQSLLETHQRLRAQKQAEALNCTNQNLENPSEILNCLSRFDGHEIAATLRNLFDFGKDNPIYLWMPVIEEDFGQESFLKEDFYQSLLRGEFHRVPILIGFTDGEFCNSVVELIENKELEKDFYENFGILAPKIFMYAGRANASGLNAAIQQRYLSHSKGGSTDLERLCDLFSDAIIRFGAYRIASLTSKYAKVFPYIFSYVGTYSNFNYSTDRKRAEHMDDIMHLFNFDPAHLWKTDDQFKMVELYTNFMYEFIQKGEPTTHALASFPQGYASINTQVEYKEGSFFRESQFWDQLFPILMGDGSSSNLNKV